MKLEPLDKIHKYAVTMPAQVNEGTAHLFIENPLSGKNIMELFSTHPPVEKLIVNGKVIGDVEGGTKLGDLHHEIEKAGIEFGCTDGQCGTVHVILLNLNLKIKGQPLYTHL